jgi:hypothetical protein
MAVISPAPASVRSAREACGSDRTFLMADHKGRGSAHHAAKAGPSASSLRSVSAAAETP